MHPPVLGPEAAAGPDSGSRADNPADPDRPVPGLVRGLDSPVEAGCREEGHPDNPEAAAGLAARCRPPAEVRCSPPVPVPAPGRPLAEGRCSPVLVLAEGRSHRPVALQPALAAIAPGSAAHRGNSPADSGSNTSTAPAGRTNRRRHRCRIRSRDRDRSACRRSTRRRLRTTTIRTGRCGSRDSTVRRSRRNARPQRNARNHVRGTRSGEPHGRPVHHGPPRDASCHAEFWAKPCVANRNELPASSRAAQVRRFDVMGHPFNFRVPLRRIQAEPHMNGKGRKSAHLFHVCVAPCTVNISCADSVAENAVPQIARVHPPPNCIIRETIPLYALHANTSEVALFVAACMQLQEPPFTGPR